jgi:hypothetical protein
MRTEEVSQEQARAPIWRSVLSYGIALILGVFAGQFLATDRSDEREKLLEQYAELVLEEILQVKNTGLPRFASTREEWAHGDGRVTEVVFILNQTQSKRVAENYEKVEAGLWTKQPLKGLSRPSIYFNIHYRGAMMNHAPESTNFIVFESSNLD